jgi:hypothetical protein
MSSTKMHHRASAPDSAESNASKQILLWPATG